MNNISRINHLVPQMYLKAWEDENHKIHVYDLLVQNKNCSEWRKKTVKGIAFQRDFYTSIENANESNQVLNAIETIALEYGKADEFIILERLMLEKANLNEKNQKLWDELTSKYTNSINMCADIKSRIGEKLKQYNQIKRLSIDKIEYDFYEAIKEKNEVINLRLNANEKTVNDAKNPKKS